MVIVDISSFINSILLLCAFTDTKKEDIRINHPKLRSIICHDGTETEEEVRRFAKKRGLHLTNWMITKMHLIKNSS